MNDNTLREALTISDRLLPGVSRTFALTIPELPGKLRTVVTNAYLLCRLADTIEDDPQLDAATKLQLHDRFVAVVRGDAPAQPLAEQLGTLLSEQTPHAERELAEQMAAVVAVTHHFASTERRALTRCVEIMCSGMPKFQQNPSIAGLADQAEMDRYCYVVAGVVGEMLTELFCSASSQIADQRQGLMARAVSFGQGLQMTNILKDFWEDRRRGACWLPSDAFRAVGLDLAATPVGAEDEDFQQRFRDGLGGLVAIAHQHLRDALDYIRLLPADAVGIRRFCLWAVGLAILTLRNIWQQPDYRSGQDVKVSRRALKATIGACNLFTRSNTMLNWLFRLASSGLPRLPGPRLQVQTLSNWH